MRITDTLHGDKYKFVIISRSVLLIIKNFSDKHFRENKNMHFVSNDIFSKIFSFMR